MGKFRIVRKVLIGIVASTLLAAGSTVLAQPYKPAIEFQSLMNLRYYEARGGFLIEDLQLVFPPGAIGEAKLVITDQTGKVVEAVPLRFEKMEFPAFGRFRPASGNPGLVNIGRSGNFVMSVVLDGQPLTTMPFSLREQNSSDPFNPVKQFVREGPFPDFAYFSVVPDDPNAQVKFNYWTSLREVGGATNAKMTLHVLVDGQELAASRGPIIPSVADWQFVRDREVNVPSLPRNHWLTLADLTKKDGEITVVVKSNGQPVKSYKTRVSGGQLQRLPQNALNWEPHTTFISPRFIDVSSGSNSNYKMLDMYWMKKQ